MEGRKADMGTIASAMARLTFSLPETDLRDLVGLDSHSYRAALVRLICEAAEYREELSQEQSDIVMTTLGILAYLGLTTTSYKRLEKLWSSCQQEFKLDSEVLTVMNRFMKKFLVNSAADARASSGRAFPATQLASCCPPLALKLLCQTIVNQAASEGKMISFGVLLAEVMGSKVAPQLAWDDELQVMANTSNFIYWSVVVNKSQTTISGLGKISNGVVLDYLATAELDNYDLYIESQVLTTISMQLFYELYESVATDRGLTFKEGGMASLHNSNPYAKLPGIMNTETGKMVYGRELLDWYFSGCWHDDHFEYLTDLSELVSAMMIAMVLGSVPVTIAIDAMSAKTPRGMEFLVVYLDKVLGIRLSSKFRRQLEIDQGFSVAISEKKFELIYKNRILSPGDDDLCFDSMTVGQQATGQWNTKVRPKEGSLLRSLTQICARCFPVNLHHWHIRGHQGEPGNELVDELARLANDGLEIESVTQWQDLVQSHKWITDLEWAWVLFDHHFYPHIKDGYLRIPTSPDTRPHPEQLLVFNSKTNEQPEEVQTFQLDLHMCTYNAMTLKEANYDEIGTPARLECLIRQMSELQVHLFAIQETRMRKTRRLTDDRYLLFQSQATERGQAGILIGIAKKVAFAHSALGDPLYFKDEDFSVMHQDPRRLLLRIKRHEFQCLLLACHAPHTGQPNDEIQSWWDDTMALIPLRYQHWDLLCLTDANARIGGEPNDSIGTCGAEGPDDKAEAFTNFITDLNLYIPSTFHRIHQGPTTTWAHTSGARRRIDYICVPATWQTMQMKSWVQTDFASPLLCDDHSPVHLTIQGRLEGRRSKSKLDMPKLRFQVPREEIDPVTLQTLTAVPWNVDIHTHAELLQNQVYNVLQPQQPRIKTHRKKQTLTEATWTLIQTKRDVRKHLNDLQQVQRTSLLAAIFSSWKSSADVSTWEGTLAMQDKAIACALHEFRLLGRQVTQAIRQDEVYFYNDLLKDCKEFSSPHQAKGLWNVIRRSLPKHKARRQQQPPMKIHELEHQWIPYLCELETGQEVSPHDLLQHCRSHDAPIAITCDQADLPSLQRVEQTFRDTAPGKATGFDPIPSAIYHDFAPTMAANYFGLMLKEYLWSQEPIQRKGGHMTMLYKKGLSTAACNYRGIMLLSTASKRLHALLTKTFEGYARPGF